MLRNIVVVIIFLSIMIAWLITLSISISVSLPQKKKMLTIQQEGNGLEDFTFHIWWTIYGEPAQ